ncbi:hypothetical protein QWY87_01995 [Lutimonas halocynthiae]|uniref:TolB family protein n=1 Tax=Lutimonas halocynthiae TaxID=1446477 RepID=UPI0025B39434|nr:hypothetical protein [Lutimonas halocynthiae]MDN3641456.1 hypothetical protein [Lutimonas halocynthiae]
MKYPFLYLLFMFSGVFGQAQNNDIVQPAFPALAEYPGIRDFTLSTEGDEAYFSIQSLHGELSLIASIRKLENDWTKPQIVSFSGKYHDLEPFLSPDNLRLYFASSRPKNNGKEEKKDYDIWYVERGSTEDVWSEPVNLGLPVNSNQNEFYPSVAANKNLYFTSDRPSSLGKDDIFVSLWNGKAYDEPKPLGESINSEGYEFNAYISPSESFLIFSGYNRSDGLGSGDLYISHRERNLSWRKAVNFGSVINSDKIDYCPFVDIKTKTLYFTSKRSSIKPGTVFNSTEGLLMELNKYDNGLSRLYKIGLETIIHVNE